MQKKILCVLLALFLLLGNATLAQSVPNDALEQKSVTEEASADESPEEYFMEQAETPIQQRAVEIITLFAQQEYESIFNYCDQQLVGMLLGYSSLLGQVWDDLISNYGEYAEIKDVVYENMDTGYTKANFLLLFETAEVCFDIELTKDTQLHNIFVSKVVPLEKKQRIGRSK